MASATVNFNDDNDKNEEDKPSKQKKKGVPAGREAIKHTCGHTLNYPKKAEFDFSIKDAACCMCQEWDNPKQKLEDNEDII